MGNQCDQCQAIQAVTQGCKRQRFRQQLNNRQRLQQSKLSYNLSLQKRSQKISILQRPQKNTCPPSAQQSPKYKQIHKTKSIQTLQIEQDFKNITIPIQSSINSNNKKIQTLKIQKTQQINKFNDSIVKIQEQDSKNYQRKNHNVGDQSLLESVQFQLGEQIKLKLSQGVQFNGNIINQKINNNGLLKFKDGTKISAQFAQGRINLSVPISIKLPHNTTYIGHLSSSLIPNGQGTLTHSSGQCYTGQWLQSKPHGYGQHKYPNGSLYQGNFVNGKKQGNGKFQDKEKGIIFEGQFRDGQIMGKGVLTKGNFTYKGNFIQGKLQGQGEQQNLSNKQTYSGKFYNGKKSGKGTITFRNESSVQRTWLQDKPKQLQRSTKAISRSTMDIKLIKSTNIQPRSLFLNKQSF